ncbi:MAG: hypothetical protein D6808_04135 [Candidatus Dadabacteria bacterium]|nr:MAG: hypothetical protein D6808_04135 [Candidatus Dadabacteria bacterium]
MKRKVKALFVNALDVVSLYRRISRLERANRFLLQKYQKLSAEVEQLGLKSAYMEYTLTDHGRLSLQGESRKFKSSRFKYDA